MISKNLFETDLINFHYNSVFFVIFLEQEISQDQYIIWLPIQMTSLRMNEIIICKSIITQI